MIIISMYDRFNILEKDLVIELNGYACVETFHNSDGPLEVADKLEAMARNLRNFAPKKDKPSSKGVKYKQYNVTGREIDGALNVGTESKE